MSSRENRLAVPEGRGWYSLLGAVLLFVLVPACAGAGSGSTGQVGLYLSAKTALERNEFAQAAQQFDRLIENSPAPGRFFQDAVFAHVAAGSFDRAAGYVRKIPASGHWSVSAVTYAEAMRRGQWAEAVQAVAGSPPLIRAFLGAWAHFGDGQPDVARQALIGIAEDGNRPNPAGAHARYHLGLLDILGGREADGLAALEEAGTRTRLRSRTVLARAAVLGAAEARAELLAAISSASDPMILRAALLEADNRGLRSVGSAGEGAAEALLTLADLFARDHTGRFALFHRQLAQQLRPEDPFVCRAVGNSFAHFGRYELAGGSCQADTRTATDRVVEIEMLERAGEIPEALQRARSLRDSTSDHPGIQYALGNFLRRQGEYAEARDAYGRSLDRVMEARAETVRIEAEQGWAELVDLERMAALADLPRRESREYLLARADAEWAEMRLWGVHFERGICFERLGDWEQAEADFFRALEGDPGNPLVVNYLGYSWVDMGIHLERGLDMLVSAATARPNDGNIADSVGWARYRLGDYEGALRDLERAVGLEPTVPEIYDHLGDVLWRVERQTEARFQWRRALTLEVEGELRDALLIKLEDGLDERARQ